MNGRKIALIAAAAMALVFGVSLFFFVRSVQHTANAPVVRVRVFVAQQNIDKGVTIVPAMFAVQMRARESVDPDTVTDPAGFAGRFALISIPAGAVLTSSKIGTPTDLGLSMRLKAGERAVSISVDHVKDIAGLVLPGDRVDVLAEGPRVNNHIQQAVIILRGIRVLAVGQGLESTSASPTPDQINASTVTLALNPKQTTVLMTADQNATIRLALRSPKERVNSESTEQLIYNGRDSAPERAQPASGAPAAAVAAAAPVAALPNLTPSPARTPSPNTGTINGVQVIEGAAPAKSS